MFKPNFRYTNKIVRQAVTELKAKKKDSSIEDSKDTYRQTQLSLYSTKRE